MTEETLKSRLCEKLYVAVLAVNGARLSLEEAVVVARSLNKDTALLEKHTRVLTETCASLDDCYHGITQQ